MGGTDTPLRADRSCGKIIESPQDGGTTTPLSQTMLQRRQTGNVALKNRQAATATETLSQSPFLHASNISLQQFHHARQLVHRILVVHLLFVIENLVQLRIVQPNPAADNATIYLDRDNI